MVCFINSPYILRVSRTTVTKSSVPLSGFHIGLVPFPQYIKEIEKNTDSRKKFGEKMNRLIAVSLAAQVPNYVHYN